MEVIVTQKISTNSKNCCCLKCQNTIFFVTPNLGRLDQRHFRQQQSYQIIRLPCSSVIPVYSAISFRFSGTIFPAAIIWILRSGNPSIYFPIFQHTSILTVSPGISRKFFTSIDPSPANLAPISLSMSKTPPLTSSLPI